MLARRAALLLAALTLIQTLLPQALGASPGDGATAVEPVLVSNYGSVLLYSVNLPYTGGLRVASHPSSPLIAVQVGGFVLVLSPWWAVELPVGGDPGLVAAAVWGPFLAVYDAESGLLTLYRASPQGLEAEATARLALDVDPGSVRLGLAGRLACAAVPGLVAYIPLDAPGDPVYVERPGYPALASCTPTDLPGIASPWEPAVLAVYTAPDRVDVEIDFVGASALLASHQASPQARVAAAFPGPGRLVVALADGAGGSARVYVTVSNYTLSYAGGAAWVNVESVTASTWLAYPGGRLSDYEVTAVPTPGGRAVLAAAALYRLSPGPGSALAVWLATVASNDSIATVANYTMGLYGDVGPLFSSISDLESAAVDAGGVYVLAGALLEGSLIGPGIVAGTVVFTVTPDGSITFLNLQPGVEVTGMASGSGRGIAVLALSIGRSGTLIYYLVDVSSASAAEEALEGQPPPAPIPLVSTVYDSRLVALYEVPSLGIYVLYNLTRGLPSAETPWGPLPLPLAELEPGGVVYGITAYGAGALEVPLPGACGLEAAGSLIAALEPPLGGQAALKPLNAVEAAGALFFPDTSAPEKLYVFLDCWGETPVLLEVRARVSEPYRAMGYLAPLPNAAILVIEGLEGTPPPGATLTIVGSWGFRAAPLPPAGSAVTMIIPDCNTCYLSIMEGGPGYIASARPPSLIEIELPGGITVTPSPLASAVEAGDRVAIVAGRYPVLLPEQREAGKAASQPTQPPDEAPYQLSPATAASLAASATVGAVVAGLACASRLAIKRR